MLRPTKSLGEEMIFNSSAVNFGASLPANCRNPSVYLPSRMTPRKPELSSRVAISAARTFSGVSNAGTQAAMFSAGPTRVPARPCARIACTASPCASATWWRTWLTSAFGSLRPGASMPHAVAEIHESPGFVDREDRFDAVAQACGHMARINSERLRGFARSPAADPVLERLGQVPVIQRRVRLDAVLEQFVDEAVVEVEALGIRRTRSFRKHPRPRDREPVGLGAEFPDQADVFLVAVVMFVGAVAGGAVLDLAGRVRKGVPDRAAAAVFIDGAFDLIGRGGGAPHKIFREAPRRVPVG